MAPYSVCCGGRREGARDTRPSRAARSATPPCDRVSLTVRAGLPEWTGHLVHVARGLGSPLLVSAGRRWRDGRLHPVPAHFDLADVALDSAGFVAMRHHGGYPWSVTDYVQLAGAYPWAWWSQMDLCCEPEIAADRAAVRARVDGSAALLRECRAVAADMGVPMPMPMPVLQGWTVDDYRRSVDAVADVVGEWPALVGVGSVCRRDLGGPDGVCAVVSALDRVLPRSTGLHLFGQKGDALGIFATWDRVASVDSCAWDDRHRHDLQERRRALAKSAGIDIREANAILPSRVIDRAAFLRAFVERPVVATPRQLSLWEAA